jgi:hypothetical protein
MFFQTTKQLRDMNRMTYIHAALNVNRCFTHVSAKE